MKKIRAKAPAKINLTLEILDKLPSGFHKLDTVMLKLNNFCDDIEIIFDEKSTEIAIESSDKSIPADEKNICHQAAESFFKKNKKRVGLKIILTKNIPHGAGLGGGSSDAATTLLLLNEYFNKPFSRNQLAKMSHPIGKDIAFFFSQKNAAFMTGLCEIKKEEFNFKNPHILIINPLEKISTKIAFENLPENIWFMKNKDRVSMSSRMIRAMKKNDVALVAENMFNDFEIVIEKKYPIIKELKQSLKAFGASGSLMSGSGSTVFGIFQSDKDLKKAKEILKKQYPNFIISKG
ncbi:MAG: 4-(cytidine 5'-diphospho)-2-C-methyl-D-erythritol kinase [Candidatus Moranbacteria bacterium]|nr:4-(cytidine 5'-diphospho)-2-C-methyl-D-erythritol kinase [Candidatus Moranbacteria bacterium]